MNSSLEPLRAGQSARVRLSAWLFLLWTAPALLLSAAPVITGFNPAFGVQGSTVTLSGTNFSPVAGDNIVYFGAARAPLVNASATSLTVTVPAGATYGPITVTVNGLVAFANASFQPTFPGAGSNIGPSSFGSRIDLVTPTTTWPSHTAIGDFDGDGKPDLAVANSYAHTLSLFQNVSTAGTLTTNSFASRVDFPALGASGDSPYGIAVADVDGDGKLDIALCDLSQNQVLVYRNISTGGTLTTNSFAAPVGFGVGVEPRYVRVADLDGDGRPDMVTANKTDNTISILRNIGVAGSLSTNSFAADVVLGAGAAAIDLAIGDLDGDGKPDIAVVNQNELTVSLYRNLTTTGVIDTNSFAARIDLPAPDGSQTIVLGDIDGDGYTDMVIGSYRSQTVSVYRNTGKPGGLSSDTFAPRVDFSTPGWTHNVALGDCNGDARPDIALVTELNSALSVFQNLSTPGGFTNSSLAGRVDYPTGWNAWGISVGDLDGDGRPDIIFCDLYDNLISIYQNQTPMGQPVILQPPTSLTVAVGGTAVFTVTALGPPPLSYQWYVNGTSPLPYATNSTLMLFNVQLAQAGNYSVRVTCATGSTLSSAATLTVTKVDHFEWNIIPSPRFVGAPFPVTITARDLMNATVTDFTGTVTLTTTNGVPVYPPVSGSFNQGAWTGPLMISQAASNLVLQAAGEGEHLGLANPIDLVAPPALDAGFYGSIMLIIWPVQPAGFALESSTSLSPAVWIPVPEEPVQIGDQLVVPVEMSGSKCFYRLRFGGP